MPPFLIVSPLDYYKGTTTTPLPFYKYTRVDPLRIAQSKPTNTTDRNK